MKTFLASLCYKGAHGGGLYLHDDHLAFRTDKLLLPADKKRLRIDYKDIAAVKMDKAAGLFPAVTITTHRGESTKFILFRRNSFISQLKGNGVACVG
ncbi:MAG: hypothetical protein LBM74_03755 [Oscillospiraceae bacterium]|jgi:hypothetical protein|nr:hypothetical protein [Oscillospiraceae bacterium]